MPLLHARGERKRQHSRLVETMQTAKGPRRSARGRLSPCTSPQCDTNCLYQKQQTMSHLKHQHSHQFLVERSGWNHQSSRLRWNLHNLIQVLIDTASTIERLSDILKQSPTLPSRRFNIIGKQRRHRAQASNRKIRPRTCFSRRPIVLLSLLKRAFAWPEQPLVLGRVDITGKLRF